ncbi:MAG: phenylalanine 4-monooxygenase [Nannocystales bacterium]
MEPLDDTAAPTLRPGGFSGEQIELVELERDHPGFNDAVYRRRRNAIATHARQFSEGDPFPDVQYNAVEQGVWRSVWAELEAEHARVGCHQYRQACEAYGFDHEVIPSFASVNARLEPLQGFTLLPVAGLVQPRVFLEALASRRFFATQYMRHQSEPLYTPEPDVVHEYIGHVPWLADAELAELNHAFGMAALRATDTRRLDALIRVYWYTIEFGVLVEDERLKVYGAGMLSSFGEMRRFEAVDHRAWNLDDMAADAFDPTNYQEHLYVAPSFARMRSDLLRWLGS